MPRTMTQRTNDTFEATTTGNAPALDVAAIRAEFPILAREIYPGVPLAYLDSAATSLKPTSVIDAISEHHRWHTANVHRGIHRLAEEATESYEQSREKVARFIHANSSSEIIFTRGTTESINLVAWSFARKTLRPGDQILLTEMEHHSNLIPWQQVAAESGASLQFIPITKDGRLDLASLDSLVTGETKLVTVTAVSNVLGTVNPIGEIVRKAHAVGACVLVDAAQSVPHLPVDVAAWDCDFLAFSGHKMCGPDGIGILYGKDRLLEAMPPFLTGGQMIRRARRTSADWNELPWKFEAGTPPISEAIGLGAAVDFLTKIGFDAVGRHESQLVAYAYARLSEIDGLSVLGPVPEHRSGLVSFTVEGIHPHDVAQVLDSRGIAIRAGHHCAQPLHTQLGIAASARASFYLYNTTDEVDRLVAGIRHAQRLLNR